jgi:toxin ParE1/3/4
MTLDIRLSNQANVDMTVIWYSIAQDNPTAADRLIETITKAIGSLASMPGIGRARPELRAAVHSYVVSPYVIFYRATSLHLEVLRVLHGARDIPAVVGLEDTETFEGI